ncbi:MAG: glycosyltransferase family 2 protein [Cyanobacteria bacterium]|nr:glycosyltransferase family 2 protein [Cyanobacteriota bacterium]
MNSFPGQGISPMGMGISAIALLFLVLQLPAVMVLLSRLLQGPRRRPPLQPRRATPDQMGLVSVVIPTLNEAARLRPCLEGIGRQTYEVREVLVVDSRSQDGTPDLVTRASQSDPRFRLMTDDPLPSGWVGRPWALHNGYLHTSAKSDWILGIDADTQPQPGLVPALITAAAAEGFDLVSLSPRFMLKTVGELWLQPALLMTLIYRFGPTGAQGSGAERVMANGQCFLCRRSLLDRLGGYTAARQSFCDDVTLARYAAAHGARVGFWDGSALLKVRMYEGLQETWREWGRSLDLKDASSKGQVAGDLWFLTSTQALPWLAVPLLTLGLLTGAMPWPIQLALGVNLSLLAVRFALQWAILPSYDLSQARSSWAFWLSPLADPLAVVRIWLSSLRVPTQWRGRQYQVP